MAKKLSEYKFRTVGRPGLYPWDEWLNGDIWEVKYGEDFWCGTESFRRQVKANARRRGYETILNVRDNTVVFQAIRKES